MDFQALMAFFGRNPMLSMALAGLTVAIIYTEIARLFRGYKAIKPAELTGLLNQGGALVVITAKSGACDGFKAKEVSIAMDGVVVTSIGFSMQVQDVLLRENIGWRFAALTVG